MTDVVMGWMLKQGTAKTGIEEARKEVWRGGEQWSHVWRDWFVRKGREYGEGTGGVFCFMGVRKLASHGQVGDLEQEGMK